MNVAPRYMPDIPEDPSMKKALIGSSVLHVAVFLFAAFGVPFLPKPSIENLNAINVEIMNISDISQTTRLAQPNKEAKTPDDAKLEEPKPQENKPKPPPQLLEPEAPKIEEKKPEEIKKPEEKIPEKPKDKPKPPEEKKPEADTKQQQSDFDSLLNDLTPSEEEPSEKTEEPGEDTGAPLSQIASLGDTMSISERDAIGQQLYPCWNVPAGAKFAENLVIEIRVFMNRDGSIRDTQILDRMRYTSDTHFRAAADAADRALRNPRCTPLKYPPEKYEQLKQFVFRFDPQDML